MKYGYRLLCLAVALVAGFSGWALYPHLKPGPAVPEIAGVIYPEPRVAAAVSLVRHDGSVFRMQDLKQWTLAYFGYSYCPDVCPITLSVLSAAAQQVEPTPVGDQLGYLFVSLDPDRDTPERLATYTPFFHTDLVGVTGDPVSINRVAVSLGILYTQPPPGDASGDYTIDHSDSLYLFEPGGALRAVFRPPHSVVVLAADISRLIEYYD